MLTKLAGARIIDPANGVDDVVRDLFMRDGRIVDGPRDGERIDRTYDVSGQIAMAGAIDLHTHIGGGKVNLARAMLPDIDRRDPLPADRRVRRVLRRSGAVDAWRPATATPRWATPPASSRRCCRPTRARRTWRWATRRSSTRAPTRCWATTISCCGCSPRGEPGADQRLRGLDAARHAGHRHQGRQCRRHQRLQVQPAQARRGRAARALPRHAARR